MLCRSQRLREQASANGHYAIRQGEHGSPRRKQQKRAPVSPKPTQDSYVERKTDPQGRSSHWFRNPQAHTSNGIRHDRNRTRDMDKEEADMILTSRRGGSLPCLEGDGKPGTRGKRGTKFAM